ncbi:MAG: MoaD/ThiS family protein [Chloroflexi bacterium]|nr:MoaD/ThiS family protein [Chloroflexota bacterium]
MAVKINISPDLQRFYDCQAAVEADGETVGECLEEFVAKCLKGNRKNSPGKIENFRTNVMVFLNKENTMNYDEPVQDGDELDLIVMPFGG